MGKYVCVLIIDVSIQSQAQIHTSGGRVLQKVGSSQALSKLDLVKVFFIRLEARARSAFVTPMGKFEFLRMLGMRNAPSTFL